MFRCRKIRTLWIGLLLVGWAIGTATAQEESVQPETLDSAPATPVEDSAAEAMVSLFDGQSLAGWQGDEGQPPPARWNVVDGVIHCDPQRGSHGHLLSVEKFADFDFRFEWKIARGGNSGVKYRVAWFYNRPGGVLSSGYNLLGLEYQLLDDAHHHNSVNPRTSLGSIYGLFAPVEDKPDRPAGQWNASRVVARGPHIEHWLNGKRVCECEIGSRAWQERIAHSKFHTADCFGNNAAGRLMLQDHGAEVWFRGLELRRLTADQSSEAESVAEIERTNSATKPASTTR